MWSQANTLRPGALINALMEKLWARQAAAGARRSKSLLPGEHGRPCCLHVSRQACEVNRMHASRRACAADCSHASRRSCMADFSHSSRLIKHLHARHRVWLYFETVNIIQPFAILTCQLFVSKRTSLATNVCASSQTGRVFLPWHICAMSWNHAKFHVFWVTFLFTGI